MICEGLGPTEEGVSIKDLADEALILRVREGDEEAFSTLFDRYAGALQVKIQQMLPRGIQRKVSVSDVLQEARIVAHKRLQEFESQGEATFRVWLFKIVQHKVRDAVRMYSGTVKRGAAQEISRDGRPDTADFTSKGPSPSEVAMGRELRQRILRLLDTLPEDYRQTLRLSRLEGLTLREVAERIGRSRDATKKLYGRALSRFAELWRAEGGEGDE